MKAFQLVAHGQPGKFELRDISDPHPQGDEVVVDVRACGLNHLDLWLEEAGLPIKLNLPRTPGGEIAGVISQLGANVNECVAGLRPADPCTPGPSQMMSAPPWQIGDRVALQSNLFCGECEFCRRGEESMCLRGELLGVQRDGGFAGKVVAPARALVRLPEAVSFETSAALTLAGSTAMHMLTDRVRVKNGDWLLVMGASSGVGSAAIQIGKALGARVITTGSTEEKRALGLRLGAEFAVDSSDPKWAAEVRKITAKRGVDVVVEHVGGEVLPKIFDCLARGGTVVTCGATAGREITFDLWPFFVKQQRLVGSYGRNRADIQATLAWAADGRLKPVIHSVFSLERTTDAFAALRSRAVLGKIVIRVGGR